MKEDFSEIIIAITFGVVIGIVLLGFALAIITPIRVSQETGDDICYNITKIDGVKAEVEYKSLVCSIPTNNIIIRDNGE